MKNKINILFLLLITAFMSACDEEQEPFNGPYRLVIVGPGEADPQSSVDFSIGDVQNPDSYTWSVVEGPAAISGPASGNMATVQFQSHGDVIIKVSNGVDAGQKVITVPEIEPVVTTSYNGAGVLKSGAKDTVFFKFATPLKALPTIKLNTDTSGFAVDTDAFVSPGDALSDLAKLPGSETTYFAIYTAGGGEGTPEAFISGVEATDPFGGQPLDSLGYVYVHLYEVDNLDPLAKLSYSDQWVSDSTVVTITATFNEPITSPAYAEDSVLYISFSGGGVEAASDTLEPTSNPLVYEYTYTVNGEGDGPVTVVLEDITDLAGNPLAETENNVLTVDNTNPVVTGVTFDNGTNASIDIIATENGTGMYLIVPDGTDAPTNAEEFLGASGIISDPIPLPVSVLQPLGTGNYDIYYLAQDGAGNYSDITSGDLVMD